MDHVEARNRLKKYASQLIWTITPVKTRMDKADWDAAHYMVVLNTHGLAFNYSMGWVCFSDSQLRKVPLSIRNRCGANGVKEYHKANYYDRAVRRDMQNWLHKKCKPATVDILHSLLVDAQGSDVTFSDWCLELGYDDDSIKAKASWELCNTHRRELESIFSAGELTDMYLYANFM